MVAWSHVMGPGSGLTSMAIGKPFCDTVKVSLKLLHAIRPQGLTLPSLGRLGCLPSLPIYCCGEHALEVEFSPPCCFESNDRTYLR